MEKKKRIVINWMAEVKTEFKIKKDLKPKQKTNTKRHYNT